MIAIGFLFGWELIALAVVGFILFWKVLNLVTGLMWRDADPQLGIEDTTANRERER